MPDTHLPLLDARTTTERLPPTLPAAHIWRISTHGYGRSKLISSHSESAYVHGG
jgi:hypothetical protein